MEFTPRSPGHSQGVMLRAWPVLRMALVRDWIRRGNGGQSAVMDSLREGNCTVLPSDEDLYIKGTIRNVEHYLPVLRRNTRGIISHISFEDFCAVNLLLSNWQCVHIPSRETGQACNCGLS